MGWLIRLSDNRKAFLYMLFGVLASSATPLAIDLGNGSTNPFLFNFLWKVAGLVGITGFVLAWYHRFFRDRDIRAVMWNRTRSWTLLMMLVAQLDTILFIYSLKFLDVAVAAVLYAIWPVLLIVILLWLFRHSDRFRDTSAEIIIPIILAFFGIVFVILSQALQISPGDVMGVTSRADFSQLTTGVILVLLAAFCAAAMYALSLRWGADLRDALGAHNVPADAELFGALYIRMCAVVPVLPIYVLIGVVSGEGFPSETVSFGLIGGLIISGPAVTLFRKANLLTSTLGLNAMGYVTPVLALTWLAVFSRVGIERIDYLVIGATAVVAANLLINFQAEIRFGFRSLIMALWACGALVYFRGDLAEELGLRGWLWPPGEYFTAVGLAATVFTLILSFRVARLIARTSDETNRTFALFSRVDLLAERGVLNDDARGYILRIDAPNGSSDLAEAYRAARREIRLAYSTSSEDAERRELAEAASELDALAHSRHEGQDFGEFVALVVFAVITVSLILLSLDAGASGWNAFLTEVFTILFSAVIIFLVINVWDLQRERGAPVLSLADVDGSYGVLFRDVVVRRFEQAVSIVVVLAMTGAYGWLLWEKWLG